MMIVLYLVVAIFNPQYGQVEVRWTQTSDAPTVLVGKFDAHDVYSMVLIDEHSHAGPRRVVDYDPHEGDRYVVSECEPHGVDLNLCHYITEGVVASRPMLYFPLVNYGE
jgi:hypothetical protein